MIITIIIVAIIMQIIKHVFTASVLLHYLTPICSSIFMHNTVQADNAPGQICWDKIILSLQFITSALDHLPAPDPRCCVVRVTSVDSLQIVTAPSPGAATTANHRLMCTHAAARICCAQSRRTRTSAREVAGLSDNFCTRCSMDTT